MYDYIQHLCVRYCVDNSEQNMDEIKERRFLLDS